MPAPLPTPGARASGLGCSTLTLKESLGSLPVLQSDRASYHRPLGPSSTQAGAFGLARAQLVRDESCDARVARCFSAVATSANTNKVKNLPNQHPPNAGSAVAKVFWRYLTLTRTRTRTRTRTGTRTGTRTRTRTRTRNRTLTKVFWRSPFGESDFVLYAELAVDSTIQYNSETLTLSLTVTLTV